MNTSTARNLEWSWSPFHMYPLGEPGRVVEDAPSLTDRFWLKFYQIKRWMGR